MNDKNYLKKIIKAAKKQPTPVVAPKPDKNTIKVKRDKPWKAPMGPAAFLATQNQPSGPHVVEKNKPKNEQKDKNKLRKGDWDSL